jgi:hypothetical protein
LEEDHHFTPATLPTTATRKRGEPGKSGNLESDYDDASSVSNSEKLVPDWRELCAGAMDEVHELRKGSVAVHCASDMVKLNSGAVFKMVQYGALPSLAANIP